jgi:uncharacterized membrane protein
MYFVYGSGLVIIAIVLIVAVVAYVRKSPSENQE